MYSTFGGLEIARRALFAQQRVLDVTGHNIANADTPGYSRQRVMLNATNPLPAPGMQRAPGAGHIGTGVEVGAIQRQSDAFVEGEIRREIGNQGYWNQRQEILHQLEVTLMEPSDVGIHAALDKYWDALQALHKDPSSLAARAVVREHAAVLTDTIRHIRENMTPLQREFDAAIQRNVVHLNSLGQQVAALNGEIAQARVMGYEPNDLLDRRDALVREMSEVAGVTVASRSQGMIAVSVGGITLVDGTEFRQMHIEEDPATNGLSRIEWAGLGREVRFDGGELQALLEGRDVLVPEQAAQLDTFAQELIEKTNEIHREGYGLPYGDSDQPNSGFNFFAGSDASDIRLDPAILRDLQNIAASGDGTPGDGTNALAMARLKQAPIMEGGKSSLGEYYSSVISRLGVQGQKAERMQEHQGVVMQHLHMLRESVSGVNFDEEMSNIVMAQHAYVAAARVMSAMDEALETLITRVGIVGR